MPPTFDVRFGILSGALIAWALAGSLAVPS
jgi:hypothetical protein